MPAKKEIRTICYDEDLHVEAYCLEGIVRPFPSHFHDHYVIGYMENGARRLTCGGCSQLVKKGDILIFHPDDTHSCQPEGEELLDDRGLNLSEKTMRELALDLTGSGYLPRFSQTVLQDEEILSGLRRLHLLVTGGAPAWEKEELFLLTFSELFRRHSQPPQAPLPECRKEVENACRFLRTHYAEPLSLHQLEKITGLSKSTLLRSFTKWKGTTPYRYLEGVRMNQAKKALEQGARPAEAALAAGFSDQSHFTNFFSRCTGITPGAYREIFLDKLPETECGKERNQKI